MTDEAFAELIEGFSTGRNYGKSFLFLHKNKLTPTQLDLWCKVCFPARMGITCVTQDLLPHHVDILLSRNHSSIFYAVFAHIPTLTPDQIQIGLDSPFIIARKCAFNHPSCTEAQKVKYHLTRSK